MAIPMAYLRGEFMPLEDAKIGVMTHAFNYGTAVFEGIRGNWNDDSGELYLFRVRDHVERLRQSAKIMRLELRASDDELVDQIQELAVRSEFREDVYIRPIVYKSSEILGVRMHNLEDDYLLFLSPFGAYLDSEAGARCMTSSWRRVDDTSIPARAKVTGLYVNNAMAKTEAQLSGFDEAILLNQDGHVSEGSGENIAILRRGVIVTPPPQDNILEGITLETALQIAREELGLGGAAAHDRPLRALHRRRGVHDGHRRAPHPRRRGGPRAGGRRAARAGGDAVAEPLLPGDHGPPSAVRRMAHARLLRRRRRSMTATPGR